MDYHEQGLSHQKVSHFHRRSDKRVSPDSVLDGTRPPSIQTELSIKEFPMFMIDYVKPENAQGFIADFYKGFPEKLGIPAPLLAFTATPQLFELQMGVLGYFMSHDTLDPNLLAAIRYLVARHEGYTVCVEFNGKWLTAAGMKPEELDAMYADPMTAPFEEKECAILAFAYRAFLEPKSIDRDYMESVLEQGWSESNLVDVLYQASFMTFVGKLTQAFIEKD